MTYLDIIALKLENCPFCGGQVEYTYHVGKTGRPRKLPHTFHHHCLNLGLDKRFLEGSEKYIRKWAFEWNTRHNPSVER